MAKSVNAYRIDLVNRNIWLFTLVSLLIVLAGLLSLSFEVESGFSFGKLIDMHLANHALLIFDGLPVYVYLILTLARKGMMRAIDMHEAELEKTKLLLQANSDFAKTLSEGDDPKVFEGMLDSELGRALKLIQLNIKSNRKKEYEVTWITEGKDMISRILRLHNEIDELSYQILKGLARYINAVQGAVYLYDDETKEITNIALLAYNRRKYVNQTFQIGEGLVGQCAFEMDYIHRTEIPEDYISISSGILGDQKPESILLIPLITNQELQGIMEFAFLESRIPKLTIQFLLELGDIIARTIFNLRVNEKTRNLLEESRKMTAELQQNEQVLHENAEEMKTTQDQLQKANVQLQKKIEEEKLAQDRLHWLLENASEIISIYNENFRLNYISPSVSQILGYSPQEMMSGKDFERIDQKASIEIRKAFDQLIQSPSQILNIEYIFIRKDGTRLHLQSTIRNLINDPSINGFVFNTRDITESRLVEKEQRMKSRMQSLSENSLDLILRISNSGIVYYANPVIEDYSGVSPEAIMNKPLGDIPLNKALINILETGLHRVSAKPVKFIMEESIPVSLGEKKGERILNFNVIPEFQENELETILFVGHDISEAKRIEKEIKITNRKVTDSINYAERIQSSILPSSAAIRKAFPNSFVYYLPKDVISGDFPWYSETKDAYFIAAVDCTGHGVPGALLSFIGFFLLNNITALNPQKTAGEICDELNIQVRKTLKQDQDSPETRDGMDLALCKVYKHEARLEFVGAHRPMYLLREGELIVYKGDRKAIGGIAHPKKPESDFTNNNVDLRKGDKMFIFTDGLSDQLGGPDGIKYSPSRIRNMLLDHPGYTLAQFHEAFTDDFSNWISSAKQIDDVLLIGIEF